MKHPGAGSGPASRTRPPVPAGRTGDDARAVASLVRRLVAAWNRGDANGFGAAFARSATYVTGAGRLVRGRRAIADLATRSAGTVRVVGPIEVRCRGAAGSTRFRWSSAAPHGPARRGVIACAVVREGTTWLVRQLTNEEHRG